MIHINLSSNIKPNTFYFFTNSVQFSFSVMSDSLRPQGTMSGFPVRHQHPELAQTHVHWVSDAIHPSHALSSLSPPSFNLSSIRVFSKRSILCIRRPTCWSFSFSVSPSMNIQDWFPLGWTGWISLQSQGLSRVFSNTSVQKYQYFSAQPSLWSSSHINTWLLVTHSFD